MADPKVVQEVQCTYCLDEVTLTTDDRVVGTTYETRCLTCGAPVTWTDEGDDDVRP